jgi:glycosyltransferase involved in cell wall biosynthesis
MSGRNAPAQAAADRKPVIIQWAVSSSTGWGIYGLHVGVNWAADPDISPVFSMPVREDEIALDPLRARALAPVLEKSHAFAAQLEPRAGEHIELPHLVIRGLGNRFFGCASAHDTVVTGSSTVGVIVFEHTAFDSHARARARLYDPLVTFSTWNREVLHANGIGPAVTILQGVDPILFHPGPRSGVYADRFLVFSGGKLEFRKGQDLVLLAFKAFAQRHPEALLVTAWQSAWPQFARGFDSSDARAGPVPFDSSDMPDVRAWAGANGIPAENVLELGPMPNTLVPAVLREMDVAVFPNRAEGGTNLVAMECMACGIPTILSANTGHLDLIGAGRCIALERQRPLESDASGLGIEGWRESDVEEIVEALEAVWRDRERARAIGAAGAAFASDLTWANHLSRLKQEILPYVT